MSNIRERLLQGSRRNRGTVTTTDATATAVAPSGGAFALGDNKVWLVTAKIAARRTDSGSESNGYVLHAVVERGANAAATAIVGTVSKTAIEETAAWDATLIADTTTGGVTAQVTGEAAKTIKWTVQFTDAVEA